MSCMKLYPLFSTNHYLLASFLTNGNLQSLCLCTKKGDFYDHNNYRPISLLLVISTVFERLVDSQLRIFIESYDILNDAQCGYRKVRSCESALLQLYKRLFSFKTSKQFSYMIVLNFSKAS